jgi:molybdate transport system regulatory protein
MNRLPGRIAQVDVAGSIALVDVDVGARRFTATLVGASEEVATWPAGMPVTLLFKETEVALAVELTGRISMRNRLPGIVTALERGQLLSKVTLDVDGYRIGAIVTTRSCDALGLAIGTAAEGLVKANEMTLMPESAA